MSEYTIEISGKSYKVKLDKQNQVAAVNQKDFPYKKVGNLLFIENNPIVYQTVRDRSGSIEGFFIKGRLIPVKLEEIETLNRGVIHQGEVYAPLNGQVIRIMIKQGERVKEGDLVLILEAMKMENEISAPVSGRLSQILVKEKEVVKTGALLFKIEEE
ncbi:MAG: biotin/lipoyl-binding protein [Candidatus Eremiobacteraeota bacterium]|nr:biotin/lipoyl-binding protein [Candidatus Eremiobacteraeota bacterium]MCL5055400.1 biotin/lipoyl-binding protein [Bacillota bacterium]